MWKPGRMRRFFQTLFGAPQPAAGPDEAPQDAAPNAAEERPTGEAAPAKPRKKPDQEGFERMWEAFDRRQAHILEFLDRLSELPAAVKSAMETAMREAAPKSDQGGRIGELETALRQIAESNQELNETLQEVVSETQKQAQLLEGIREAACQRHQAEAHTAVALKAVSEALENLDRSNAAHIEVIEQMRDHWAAANEDIAGPIVRQGRMIRQFLIAVVVLLGVLAAAAVLSVVNY